MSYSKPTLDQIRSRADLVAIIGRSVELRKEGASWKGCCPFHGEKTPSFDVDPKRGTFHCFGCQEQGDVFAFVQKVEGLNFPDAVRSVAAEVGVELEEQRRGSGGRSGHSQGGRARSSSRPDPSRTADAEVRDIGEARGAKVVCRYDYEDIHGQLVYQVERMEPKTFRQRRPHPTVPDRWVYRMKEDRESGLEEQPTILYQIPKVAAGLSAGDDIWICEGEKDVGALDAAMLVATCNTGGAGKWRDELSGPFKGFRGLVRIVQHRDEVGKAHALKVFESLAAVLDGDATLMIVQAQTGNDAADHLGAGLTPSDFVQVWPLPDNLLEEDPQRFKQIMLRRALEVPVTALEHTRHLEYKAHRQPLYESGLLGLDRPIHFQGCVVISGLPSTAKSYVALSAGIDNSLAGWDVFHLDCEMSEQTTRDRAARVVASHGLDRFDPPTIERIAATAAHSVLPDRFHIVNVQIGVTIEDLIAWLADRVTERPTLVVLDSISSFIDNMAVDAGDAFGMAQLREITRWITGVSKLSHGQIAFLVLSEMNKESRPKGRSLDYRCDVAIAMASSEEEGHEHVKEIRITKNWHGPTGRVGSFVHWWQIARLCRTSNE